MGKHLIQKEKEIKDRNKHDEAKAVNTAEQSIMEALKVRNKIKVPRGLASGLGGAVVSSALLALIPFLPFEGWILRIACAVILVISALELIWDLIDNIQLKEYFAYQNIVLLSVILAFTAGFHFEAVLMAVLHRITKLVLIEAEKSSWEKINEFSHIVPEKANVETSEGILNVEPGVVNAGDIITVAPDEYIPLDGVIIEGISTIDTFALSGQSSAIAVAEGHRVYSGCRNVTSTLRIKTTKNYEQSTAFNIAKLAETSPEYYSRQEKFIVILKRYFPLAVLIAAVLLCASLSAINKQWFDNIGRAVVILGAAASSACLVSVSHAYIRTIGNACERGIFVKGSDCIESMARAETVVFDKTGIITEGKYHITDVFPNKVSEQQLLSMAATAERFSRHPIAIALREAAGPLEIDYKALQIEEIPGRGISAFVGEKQVYVGNTALLEEHGIKCSVPTKSGMAIHVAVDYKYWGHILFKDKIRRGAFDSLENLRATGVKKLVLLTGDVLSVAKPLASKLNFDMLRAELKPSEKVSAVEFLMANRGDSTTLAFVGDGSSDEQIMSRVDVAIAVGALGSDTAFASADVLIMDRNIKKISEAIKLSRLSYHIALENMLAWLAVNALVIILGAVGAISVLSAIIIEFLLVCAVLINTGRIK